MDYDRETFALLICSCGCGKFFFQRRCTMIWKKEANVSQGVLKNFQLELVMNGSQLSQVEPLGRS